MDKKKRETAKDNDKAKQVVVEESAAPAQGAACEESADRLRQLEEALAVKEAEAAANWEKFVRERADLENLRKRAQKEKEEILKYGNEGLLLEILPAVDNLERALEHADAESGDAVIAGVRMTLDMLLAALRKFGVQPVEATRGTNFDPAHHQAMGQVECPDQSANTIVEVYQKGYLLNERLLRPAMVSVACSPKQ